MNILKSIAAKGAFAAFLASVSSILLADELNLRPGVTEISKSVYDLHNLILLICVVIGVVVYGVMFVSMYFHRKSRGHEAAQFDDNHTLEIAWTIIPTLILVGMFIPSYGVLKEIYNSDNAEMTVEVRGYQWKWEYKYVDEDYNNSFSFFSNLATPRAQIKNRQVKTETYLLEVDEPLRIPANRKVKFLVTAEDVIHAWWVPDFGIKRDAVPGIINELWAIVPEPGTYRGQCTELCGKDHGFMPIVVEVLPEREFDLWYQDKVAEKIALDQSTKTQTDTEFLTVSSGG